MSRHVVAVQAKNQDGLPDEPVIVGVIVSAPDGAQRESYDFPTPAIKHAMDALQGHHPDGWAWSEPTDLLVDVALFPNALVDLIEPEEEL